MDPSAIQHQELFGNFNSSSKPQRASPDQLEPHHDHNQKKPRPQPEESLKCPRCDSINTKFCYYNNYSLSQPRYFCKSCRRYWTKGGTLRNIPVGGGCRKNRRSSSSSSSSTARIRAPDQSDDMKMIRTAAGSFCGYNEQTDLGLAFALLHKQPPGQLRFHDEQLSIFGNSPADDVLGNSTSGAFGASQNTSYAIGNAGGLDQMGSEPNKLLWGFPWQMSGESFGMNFGGLDQIDPGRESWNNNGMMSSSWHGLLNTSPLI